MKVKIKYHHKPIATLTLTKETSITEIKEAIYKITSYPIKVQHLFHNHCEITDGHFLSDYNIKKDITLNLIIIHL